MFYFKFIFYTSNSGIFTPNTFSTGLGIFFYIFLTYSFIFCSLFAVNVTTSSMGYLAYEKDFFTNSRTVHCIDNCLRPFGLEGPALMCLIYLQVHVHTNAWGGGRLS